MNMETDHVFNFLKSNDSPDNFTKTSPDVLRLTALHEAGHIAVSEVLCQRLRQ